MSSEREARRVDAAVVAASGPVVRSRIPGSAVIGEVARVGPQRLLAEVIHVHGDVGTLQVYEETQGLRVGDPVQLTGAPLVAWLGPGLLGRVYDGLQRPLDTFAQAGTWQLQPGSGRRGTPSPDHPLEADRSAVLDALGDTRWDFRPRARPGATVGPGDVLGEVTEGGLRHSIMVPPGMEAGVLRELDAGAYTAHD
ncbi:MAG: hypothetical protein PVH07_04425, partial [Chloroflexota bacterium]